jgi:hypothetical protein
MDMSSEALPKLHAVIYESRHSSSHQHLQVPLDVASQTHIAKGS